MRTGRRRARSSTLRAIRPQVDPDRHHPGLRPGLHGQLSRQRRPAHPPVHLPRHLLVHPMGGASLRAVRGGVALTGRRRWRPLRPPARIHVGRGAVRYRLDGMCRFAVPGPTHRRARCPGNRRRAADPPGSFHPLRVLPRTGTRPRHRYLVRVDHRVCRDWTRSRRLAHASLVLEIDFSPQSPPGPGDRAPGASHTGESCPGRWSGAAIGPPWRLARNAELRSHHLRALLRVRNWAGEIAWYPCLSSADSSSSPFSSAPRRTGPMQ